MRTNISLAFLVAIGLSESIQASEQEELTARTPGTRTVIGQQGNFYKIYPGSHVQFLDNRQQIDYPGSVLFIAEGGLTIRGTKLTEGEVYVFNDKREPQLTKDGEYSVWITFNRDTPIFSEKNGKGERVAVVKSGEKVQLSFASSEAKAWHRVRVGTGRMTQGWINGEGWEKTIFTKGNTSIKDARPAQKERSGGNEKRDADRLVVTTGPNADTLRKWQASNVMVLVITLPKKNLTDVDEHALPTKKEGGYGPIAKGRLNAALEVPGVPLSSLELISTEAASTERAFRLTLYLFRDAAQCWPAKNGNDTNLDLANVWGLDGFKNTQVQSSLLGTSFGGKQDVMAFMSYDVLLTGEMDSSGSIKGAATGWVSGSKKMQFQNADFSCSPFDPADPAAKEAPQKPSSAAPGVAEPKPVPASVADEKEASKKLNLAKALMRAGKNDLARKRYEEIIKQFPSTRAAEEARELLGTPNTK